MKRSRFSDSQIMSILKKAEAGTPVQELCREMAQKAVRQKGISIRLAVKIRCEADTRSPGRGNTW